MNLYMKKEHTKTKVTNFTVRDLASNIGDAGATSQQLRRSSFNPSENTFRDTVQDGLDMHLPSSNQNR